MKVRRNTYLRLPPDFQSTRWNKLCEQTLRQISRPVDQIHRGLDRRTFEVILIYFDVRLYRLLLVFDQLDFAHVTLLQLRVAVLKALLKCLVPVVIRVSV